MGQMKTSISFFNSRVSIQSLSPALNLPLTSSVMQTNICEKKIREKKKETFYFWYVLLFAS